jgi:hypothetical protein
MARQLTPAQKVAVSATAVIALGVAGIGIAVAQEPDGGPPRVSCPSVPGRLPAVPAPARAEVDRELAQLDRQIAEANDRLAKSQGEDAPEVAESAILGPLAEKRKATLDRITISIGRHGPRPVGLDALARCTLGSEAAAAAPRSAGVPAGQGRPGSVTNPAPPLPPGGDAPPAAEPAAAPAAQATGAEAPAAVPAGTRAGGPAGAARTVVCPSVADRLPAVPAPARAEVDHDLALLDRQVAEANDRLARSRGEGGPNVVDNAVLGSLADRRRATLDRITISIGRNGPRPVGLDALARCTLGG